MSKAPLAPAASRIALAKLSAPRRRQPTVERAALCDRLDRELAAAPACVVSAPAGFGKTTLVAAWLQHRLPAPAAWVSLDDSDRDGARFVRSVVAALQTVVPEIGAAALISRGAL